MPEHKSSVLLTQEENDLIFNLLGYKCETLATTVIELYTTGGPTSGEWHHKETGILCLVKDSNKRSYFFRLYCPVRKRLLWEHEIYNNIQYITPTSFLHTFEAENCIAGFNFANEEEGSKLHAILLETLELRKQRRVEKTKRSRYNSSNMMKVVPQTNGVSYSSSFITQPLNKVSKKEGKRKYSKADIGPPQDFRHVSHVGWDPNKGFDFDKADDPQLKEFFVQAGVSETHLRDKETRDFIYDFIARNGGIEAVKEEMEPPPIPARVRAPPKPPVNKNLGPPPPPPLRLQPPRNLPSTPKQEIVTEPTFTPPPPPPPPGPPPGPPPPPSTDDLGRNKVAVLQELTTKGKQLKPLNPSPETEEKKPPTDSHCQLMDQIRKGIDLKPVATVTPAQNRNIQPSGLAGALAQALANRKKDIQGDSSSTSDSDEAFDDDEWDD